MTFKVNIVQINFSLLNQSDQIAGESFLLLLEPIGNIHHGLKLHSDSLLKTELIFKPDIIRLILVHWQDVFQVKTLAFYFHSELTSMELLTP